MNLRYKATENKLCETIMQKKIIIFTVFIGLSLTHDAVNAKCTELNIYYISSTHRPGDNPNWTADVWYTPCGAAKEAGTAYYARQWKDNKLSIESGTRVRIGPEGTTYDLDDILSGDHVDIECSGTIGKSHSDKDYAKCRVIKPLPLQSCTNVVIDYTPKSHWEATIQYTPCGEKEETKSYVSKWTDNSYMIASGSRVRIGPLLTYTNFIDQVMTGPKVHVLCVGETVGLGNCVIK
jgi:hypothetical protein